MTCIAFKIHSSCIPWESTPWPWCCCYDSALYFSPPVKPASASLNQHSVRQGFKPSHIEMYTVTDADDATVSIADANVSLLTSYNPQWPKYINLILLGVELGLQLFRNTHAGRSRAISVKCIELLCTVFTCRWAYVRFTSCLCQERLFSGLITLL